MKTETEITVTVKCDYNTLKQELEKNNFNIVEEYEIRDIYMIDKRIDLKLLSILDILKKCIIVRDIVNIKKVLLYKYKKFSENWDIIKQWKVECPITDISKATDFMESIDYKQLFKIYDKCIVFANNESELIVQIVNNEHLFIEMETKWEYINKKYYSVQEMIDDLNRYNLPIDNSSYYAKKAEIILKDTLKYNK